MQSCLQTAMSTNQGKQQRIMKPIIPIIVLTLISAATTASEQVLAQGVTPEGLTTSTDAATRTTPLTEDTRGRTADTDTATRMTLLTENTQGLTTSMDTTARMTLLTEDTQGRTASTDAATRMTLLTENTQDLTTSMDTATRMTTLTENTQGSTASTDTARTTPLTENTQSRTASADSPAQQAQAKALTLRECMEYAVSNSTQVRIQQSMNDDARLDRRDAILEAFTPSAEGNSYGYYRWGRSIDPETNTYLTTTSFNQGFSVSAGFTIFNGFSAINNLKIARTSMSMGISKEQQERDKVCLATIEAYFNVIYYTKLAEILTEQVENARNAVRLAERQEELGSKGYADVVQMKADLADREYELTTATNNRDNAMITLEDVMYWPVDEKLTIDPELSSIQTGASSPAADDIIANAVRSMPSVLIAKGSMDNALRSLNTAKWQFLPTLGLYGGWSTSYYTYPGQTGYKATPYWEQFKNNGGEYVQLSLNIPIYDRLQKHTALAKKRNAYQRASLEYDKSLRDVESEVRRAIQDRDGAESALLQAERRADVYDEAFKLNARKFEQGLISSIEYNTASSNYLKAKAERLNAELQYQLKRRVVEYYNGVSYIDQ